MGCGASKPKSNLKNIVIVGGGYSGSYLVILLQDNPLLKVTLVDPKDCMQHYVAVPRCIVEPEFLMDVFIPFQDFVKNFVRDTVLAVNRRKKLLMLKTGKKLPYDYLVIATGSTYPFPGKVGTKHIDVSREEAVNLYKTFNTEMKRSPDIVIIGASLQGLQIAGEIRTDYPDKKVTIIYSGDSLTINGFTEEALNTLKESLDRKEVDLVSKNEISNIESLTFNQYQDAQFLNRTNGKKIEANLVLDCESYVTMTDFGKEVVGECTQLGKIKVDQYMKVCGCDNVYAIGEVTNIAQVLMPHSAKSQAAILASNLIAEITGGDALTPYQPDSQLPIMVTIGRYGGVGLKNGKLMDEEEVMEEKSANYYTSLIWKELGLSPSEL